MVWSSKLKFNICVGSNKWLLKYSIFNIFRLSFIGGCLHLKDLQIWFGHISQSLKFESDPLSEDVVTAIYFEHQAFLVTHIMMVLSNIDNQDNC